MRVLRLARVGRRFAEQEMYIVLAKVNANSFMCWSGFALHTYQKQLNITVDQQFPGSVVSLSGRKGC